MKALTNQIIILLISTSLFNCSSNNPDNLNPDGDYLTCDISNNSFNATYTAGAYAVNTLAITGMILGTDEFVNITIYNPVEGTTYNLESITNEVNTTSITVSTATDEYYTAGYEYGSGTITLSYYDGNSAAGNFDVIADYEGIGDGSVSITDGEFSVTSIIKY